VIVDTGIGARFEALGGVFVTPAAALAEKLERVRGLIFDWDGVFNAGTKGQGAASTYSEPDSMGTNLLRFALWRAHREVLPVAAVISGAENPSAREFAEREHFHAVYTGVKDKRWAADALGARHGLAPAELIAVFDDVNDLGFAARCGIRVLVRRDGSPLTRDYAVSQRRCDYVTAQSGDRYAVREICELLLGLLGAFEAVAQLRLAWDEEYRRYFAARQAVATEVVDGPAGSGGQP
jgi:3-deoxy-D-manno-octulosonate 8-phosphate phosphatase (KDO 8-P phosphatase)